MRRMALLLALLLILPCAARAGDGPIKIGIVYPEAAIDEDTFYREGLMMALEAINASGGALGRQLVPVFKDDGNDITNGLIIGQSMIDEGVAAVIGHWSSNVCFVARDLYEAAHLPMISPAATAGRLMDGDVQFTFRTIPGCQAYANALARDMAARGLRRIAIYYTDDVYGFAYANYLEKSLSDLGVAVADRVTSVSPQSAQRVADRWTAFGVDGVFIAATMPDAADAIHLIRSMHPTFPVYGAENFDRMSFRAELDGDASRTYAAGFDLAEIDQAFLRAYREKFGHDPHVFTITGYMAVMMLKDAFEAVGGTDGDAVAAYLRSLKDYPSIGGALSYDPATKEFTGHALTVRGMDLQ